MERKQAKRILLAGNPNVGKSAIFSRLTGARVVISNYPGTTVEFTQGYTKVAGEQAVVMDAPGTYTLEATCKAEEVACRMLKESDLVINVVDATNLERNLYLTLQLLESKVPMLVILNMWDDTKHRGIEIDVGKLEQFLGVPVIPTCGVTGEGIKTLVERLSEAQVSNQPESSAEEKWCRIGTIIQQTQKLHHHHHTFLQALQDASVQPLTGIPIAAAVIYGCFWLIRFIGEGLIGYVFEPLFDGLWLPVMTKFSVALGGGGFLHDILIGHLIEGGIDFGQSFGLLTTGIFIPIGAVLPYIVSFYFVLGLLEDFGYLPRLAVLVDNVMHRLGLHGYSIVPMILGLGCNVPGALATRILEGRREKFITATLMAIAVPCMAQIAMIVGLVGERGGQYLLLIFVILFLIWYSLGAVLNRFVKGTSPELILEIPPYRFPHPQAVGKKLWMRVEGFITTAVPFVLAGIFFVNILYSLKVIDFFSGLLNPVLSGLWGLPTSTMGALLIGFLRKDVAVGMLGPLGLTTKQLVTASTILAIYFPCVATFAVLVKELGIIDMLKSMAVMIAVALVVGGLLNLLLPAGL